MKKLLTIAFFVIMLFGCNLTNTPSNKVSQYLDNFNQLSDDVILDVESKVSNENLSNSNKDIYKKVLSRVYQDMKYEIKDESINGDKAIVTVKITVYDLYKSKEESDIYMNENTSEFYKTDNTFDSNLYDEYRLNKMLNQTETVDYEITFNLNKKDGEWVLDIPDRVMLEKLNGLYNYNND